ncbi:hypothetical protein OD635_005623 [Salmonella enterica]|nr:hypothetical protein [Salmonella enterica]
MKVHEIPLTSENQHFSIQLAGRNLILRFTFRDEAGWIMDISDMQTGTLVSGVPLIPDTDLLAQYHDIQLGGKFRVVSDDDVLEYPSKSNLGTSSHLYFIEE